MWINEDTLFVNILLTSTIIDNLKSTNTFLVKIEIKDINFIGFIIYYHLIISLSIY